MFACVSSFKIHTLLRMHGCGRAAICMSTNCNLYLHTVVAWHAMGRRLLALHCPQRRHSFLFPVQVTQMFAPLHHRCFPCPFGQSVVIRVGLSVLIHLSHNNDLLIGNRISVQVEDRPQPTRFQNVPVLWCSTDCRDAA